MTVKTLAELAGVSPATISLVLNNRKGVSDKKRQEILDLIEKYGYTPPQKDPFRKRNILFIKYSKTGHIVEENVGFISGILDAVEAECQKLNYQLTIMARERNLEEALKVIEESDFYGIIILGTELEESDYQTLKSLNLPYVIVDNSMPHFACNSVAIDNKDNVYKIIEYFAEKGFEEIGYFKGNENIQNFKEREEGFYEAAARFNLKFSEEDIFEVPSTMLGAFEVTQTYLEQKRRLPKCVFADNDIIAIGVMKALNQAGYEIPDDISVIGFDNIPFAQIHSPTITTMNVDTRILGELALKLLRNVELSPKYNNIKIKVGGELIPRQSTL